jgi:hypothetical protein
MVGGITREITSLVTGCVQLVNSRVLSSTVRSDREFTVTVDTISWMLQKGTALLITLSFSISTTSLSSVVVSVGGMRF